MFGDWPCCAGYYEPGFSNLPHAEVRSPKGEASKHARDSPPFLESTVTFTITPNATGGTCLRIVHQLTDARFDGMARAAANSNSPPLMLAA